MNTEKVPLRMKREDRRAQILDAAMSVFVKKGFTGSTTLEIAKAANISEVTLFRHFASKQDIFLAGIEPILFNTLEGSINLSAHFGPQEMLENILFERIRLISDHCQVIRLILSEAHLLTNLGAESFMNRIIRTLHKVLVLSGVPTYRETFALRILMGSILSFVYMPQTGEEDIKAYAGQIASIVLGNKNQINREDD
jgi:AcrR family transcriptional regulator